MSKNTTTTIVKVTNNKEMAALYKVYSINNPCPLNIGLIIYAIEHAK